MQRTTKWSTRFSCVTTKPARSATGSRTTRSSALATQVGAPPAGATVVANPAARGGAGARRRACARQRPVSFRRARRRRDAAQMIGEGGGDGFQTMVTGQKVRWVLDLMRASEFAGRQIHTYEVTPVPSTTDQHDILLIEARGGDERIDLTELKEHMLALGEAGHTMSLRVQAAPVRHLLFDTGEIEAFGWSSFTAAEGDAPTRLVSGRPNRSCRTNISTSRSIPPTARTRSKLPTVCASKVAVDSSMTATAATPTTTPPPTEDLVVDRPDSVQVMSSPRRARLGACHRRRRLLVARARRGRRTCVHSAERAMVRATVRTTLELHAGEKFLRVAHEIDNPAHDHRLHAHFPLPNQGRGFRRGVRVRGRASRPDRGRRCARIRAPHLSVAALRRCVRWRHRTRPHPRRSARVRGRRRRKSPCPDAPTSHRLSLAHRTATATEPGRSAAGTRRSATAGEATRRVRGDGASRRLASPPTVTAPPMHCWFRSNARGSRPTRVRPARRPGARSTSSAPRFPRLHRVPGGLVVARVPHGNRSGAGDDRTRGRPGARLRDRPPRPTHRRLRRIVDLRPFEIATLQGFA